ncbi:putative membrane protein [[Clostridium] sordellii ATCC 9714]|nr:putative membrane protein [[Clostridium] sordellii ATCC 9714] [Paeniclostridium sordellii ATCC 9714]
MFIALLEFKRGDVILGYILSIFFILSFISLICFVIGEKPKFKNTVFALEGLWQRVLCLFMYAPFIVWIMC